MSQQKSDIELKIPLVTGRGMNFELLKFCKRVKE